MLKLIMRVIALGEKPITYSKQKINILISALKLTIRQTECQEFKDNLLLVNLLKKSPRIGERNIEYPWMLRNLDNAKGKILDVGSTQNSMILDFMNNKVELYSININATKNKEEKKIKIIKGDIRSTSFPSNYFDYITCISTLEHIGVKGRYRIKTEDKNGDLKAVKEMYRILKQNGILLVTMPYGKKDVLPINKLYDKKRVKNLFKDFKIENIEYTKYSSKYNFWYNVGEKEAAKTDWLKERWYALCFIKAGK